MKRKKLWLSGLGLAGGIVVVALILVNDRLAPQPAASEDSKMAAPLIALSPQVFDQDPNQAELLQRIEAQGSAAGLDFSSRDLSYMDLSPEALAEVQRVRELRQPPVWLDTDTGGADLTGINFRSAMLVNAILSDARLVGANLQGALLNQADLRGANLATADLRGANLVMVDLHGANLGKANLTGADFSLANLAQADLWRADLSDAYLLGADLSGTRLAFADLSRVNLAQTASLDGASLYRARLDGVILTRSVLGAAVGEERAGEYDRAREVYVALKNVFRAAGRYQDARWAAIKERQMEQSTHWPPVALRIYGGRELGDLVEAGAQRLIGLAAFYVRHTAAYAALWLWGMVSSYNQSPLRVVITSVIVWLGLALLYRLTGGLAAADARQLRAVDYLRYSFGALAVRDWSDMEPVGKGTRTLTQLAPLIGFALIALFIVTLNN